MTRFPAIGNRPVQTVIVKESIQHKWVNNNTETVLINNIIVIIYTSFKHSINALFRRLGIEPLNVWLSVCPSFSYASLFDMVLAFQEPIISDSYSVKWGNVRSIFWSSGITVHVNLFTNEPAHDKTYNKTCLTSKDSNQPVHPSSMARVLD